MVVPTSAEQAQESGYYPHSHSWLSSNVDVNVTGTAFQNDRPNVYQFVSSTDQKLLIY